MGPISTLNIQGMARKFIRGSIIEDAAARLVAQIMIEVSDAHIAPRDAEISRLTARVEELERVLKPFARGASMIERSSSEEARKGSFCHWPASYAECVAARTALGTAVKDGGE